MIDASKSAAWLQSLHHAKAMPAHTLSAYATHQFDAHQVRHDAADHI